MPIFSDEEKAAGRTRLDALDAVVRSAAAHRAEDPFGLAEALLAVDDPRLREMFNYATTDEMFAKEFPELDGPELSHYEQVGRLTTRDEVAQFSWPKMEMYEQLVSVGAVQRADGGASDARVKVPGPDGKMSSKRFAKCSIDELKAALEAFQHNKKPDPPPPPLEPKAPLPPPPPPVIDASPRSWRRPLWIAAAVLTALLTLWIWLRPNRTGPEPAAERTVSDPPSAGTPITHVGESSAIAPTLAQPPAVKVEAPPVRPAEPARAVRRARPAAETPAPTPAAEPAKPRPLEDEANDLTQEQLEQRLRKHPPQEGWDPLKDARH
jgi:hypothetical protein